MRRGLITGLVGAALSVALLASAGLAVGAKAHRLLLPAPERLATGLQVDEDEWSLTASRPIVAAGPDGAVSFSVFNRGEDDHDFAVLDSDGALQKVDLGPGANGTVTARLAPGRHKLYCTLPGHEALGMVTHIQVADQYDAEYAAWEAEIARLLGPLF